MLFSKAQVVFFIYIIYIIIIHSYDILKPTFLHQYENLYMI
jgi:hypothetical protein